MRKITSFILLIFLSLYAKSQISIIGFDTIICGHPVNYSYVYQNWNSGAGSSLTFGYDIYRNQTKVYSESGLYYQDPRECEDLFFINDSVGFKYSNWGTGAGLARTENYGTAWSYLFQYYHENYFKAFVLNQETVYLVTTRTIQNKLHIYVRRCTPTLPAVKLIDDTLMTQDIYITDSTLTTTLCHIKSLQLKVKNDQDTITYYFNFDHETSGIVNNVSQLKQQYLFPNPADSHFRINNQTQNVKSVQVLDFKGCVLRRYGTNEIACNYYQTENLRNGIYIIQVVTDRYCYALKLIINRS
ncbi:MAG: T9SS type A sorting domain-containing protein [Bacteroidales bacterium]